MTWKADPTHSTIAFSGKHMLVAKVKGQFKEFDAEVTIDETDLANSSATFRARVDSIDSGFDARDNHLKSADFFDAERYPEITFTTKRIEPKGKDRFRFVGDLKIRDISREVAFEGEAAGPLNDPWGGTRLVLSAEAKINRKDWGLQWNLPLGADGMLVSDDINLSLDAEFQKVA